MNILDGIGFAVGGLLLTAVMIPLIRSYALACGPPPGQSQEWHHSEPPSIPRVGGIALMTTLMVVAGVGLWVTNEQGPGINWQLVLGITLPSLLVFGIGLRDDFKSLGAKKKLFGQIAVASLVYLFDIRIDVLENPFTGTVYPLGGWGSVITVAWVVGLTNLINLIDGLDGLAGGASFMLMSLLAYIGVGAQMSFPTLLALGMAGALLGFLIYNFPPAKVYMGDSGAYLLGFLIGVLAIVNSQKGSVIAALLAPMLALTLPIVDVGFAIVRRGFKGLPIFRADQQHIHHRLVRAGHSRRSVVLTLYGILLVSGIAALVAFSSQGRWTSVIFGMTFVSVLALCRPLHLIESWRQLGRQLQETISNRDKTKHIVSLSRWLPKEAKRFSSMKTLWQEFQFMLNLMNFSKVTFQVEGDEVETWQASSNVNHDRTTGNRFLEEYRLNASPEMKLVVVADSDQISRNSFEVWSELAAETWHAMLRRWQAATGSQQYDLAHVMEERGTRLREVPTDEGEDKEQKVAKERKEGKKEERN